MLRVITSPGTTALLLVLLASSLALITVLEAREGPRTAGGTFPLYGSWWLEAAFALVFGQLAACLLRRRLLTQVPLLLVHVGVGLLLLGAWRTAHGSIRGTLTLAEGERAASVSVPGALWIDVSPDEGHPRRVELPRDQRTAPGFRVRLPWLGEARLVQVLPRARIRHVVRERTDELGVPAIHLDVITPHGTLPVVLAEGSMDEADVGDLRISLGHAPPSHEPALVATVRGSQSRHPLRLPEDVGRIIPLGDVSVTILAYTGDFRVGAAAADEPPRNPALRCLVSGTTTPPETLWVFARFPGFARPRTPGVQALDFVMPSSPEAILSLAFADGTWRFYFVSATTEASGTCAEGDTFFVSPVPSMRVPLVVRRLLPRGELVPEVEPAPAAGEAPSAVRLELGSIEPVWLIQGGPEVVIPGPGGHVALSLTNEIDLPFSIALVRARREDYPNSSIPRLYESTIRVGTNDSLGPPLLVRTNAPARVRGWRIYQAEFGTDGVRTWSGFQVATDPGASLASLGVLAVTLGSLSHLARRRARSVSMVGALLILTAAEAQALPLGDLIVSEGGRKKPLGVLARETEIEWGVRFRPDPLTGFLRLAFGDSLAREEPLVRVQGALVLQGVPPGARASLTQIERHRPHLDALAGGGPSSEEALRLLRVAQRLSSLEELVALAPGPQGDSWVPPTQETCPTWASEGWRAVRDAFRADRADEASSLARALVREQRRVLGPRLPSPLRATVELAWHRIDPPRLAPLLACVASAAHWALVATRRTRGLLLPLTLLTAWNGVSLAAWVLFAGRLPLLNTWEVFSLLLFLVPAIALVAHRRTGLHAPSGVALLLCAAGSIGQRFLPASSLIVRPPVAILQSPWRELHILSTICSYALLFLGSGLAVASSARTGRHDLSRFTHRVVLGGTVLLGVGIASGAAWAFDAWGRYWGWDPKEVWALVSWLLFTAALHARASGHHRAWTGLVLAGFGALLFTFFGVTFLLPGLHSYG